MFISNIKIWNFRKYGTSDKSSISEKNYGLSVDFKNGLNLLVGENDSGKTAIIDAIKYLLNTQSREYLTIEEKDFHWQDKKTEREKELRIECRFSGFTEIEASSFLEWLHIENNNYELRVWLTAEYRQNRIISNVKAGIDEEGTQLDGEARNLLRVTYLKPLRDAESELTPGYKSRLAQILKNLPEFHEKKDEVGNKQLHIFEEILIDSNNKIKNYFSNDTFEIDINGGKRKIKGAPDIKSDIQQYLNAFFPTNDIPESDFSISGSELVKILQKLELSFGENKSGLGSMNLLFIATELLLWKHTLERGLKLLLIEEIEAHLHAQAQLRLIDYLNKESGQFILTTHSTTLASKANLECLFICTKNGEVFPMSSEYTELSKANYSFLQRFLDSTKANLFFAKGVILVEGDSENLLLPTIAEIIEKPLHKFGVSIVNVGSKAFLHYARIFLRKNEPDFKIPVAVITDLDQPPFEYYEEQESSKKVIYQLSGSKLKEFREAFNTVDYSIIEKEIFTSIDELKDRIRYCNENNKLFPGQKLWIENNKKEIEREIIQTDISSLREKRKKILNENSKKDVKWFFNKNWTLEYEFALSELRCFQYFSILACKYYDKNNSISDEERKEINEQIDNDFKDWETNEKIAFNIYNQLLTKKASKAITAQILAQELLKAVGEGKDIKEILKAEPTLKYLVDAINHVTTGL